MLETCALVPLYSRLVACLDQSLPITYYVAKDPESEKIIHLFSTQKTGIKIDSKPSNERAT